MNAAMTDTPIGLREALATVPLVAILRGVRADEVVAVAAALVRQGFQVIEIPLNSPDPLVSIDRLAKTLGPRVLVGAGTVLTEDDALGVVAAGGRLLVAPDCNPAVGEVAMRHAIDWCPGVFTPTEAFAALRAGAAAVKLFPAEALPPPAVRAMRAVLPGEALLLPVGGIAPERMRDYRLAGASGFGLGSALYRPGMSIDQVERAARRFVAALGEP